MTAPTPCCGSGLTPDAGTGRSRRLLNLLNFAWMQFLLESVLPHWPGAPPLRSGAGLLGVTTGRSGEYRTERGGVDPGRFCTG